MADWIDRFRQGGSNAGSSTGTLNTLPVPKVELPPGVKPRKEKTSFEEKLPKGTDRNQFLMDFYIPDKMDQESLKAKTVSTVKALVDVLDNFQRPYRAITGMLYSLAEKAQYGTSELDPVDAFVKGLENKERKTLRDFLDVAAPKQMQYIEDNTKFKVFGFDADAASVLLFFADGALDPLMWIPYGMLGKGAKTLFKGASSGMRKGAELALGAETVDKAMTQATEKWFNTVQKHLNIRPIWKYGWKDIDGKPVQIEHYLDDFVHVVEASPFKREQQIREAAKVGESRWGWFRLAKMADDGSIKDLFKRMSSAADETIGIADHLKARQLHIDIESYLKLDQFDKILGGLDEYPLNKVPTGVLKRLQDHIDTATPMAARLMSQRLLERKGIKMAAKQFAGTEKMVSVRLAEEKFKNSSAILTEAIRSRGHELGVIQKELKSGTNAYMKVLGNDIQVSGNIIKEFEKDLWRAVREQTPEAIQSASTRMKVLQERISGLAKYGVEETKHIQRASGQKLTTLNQMVRELEMDLGRAGAQFAGATREEVVSSLQKNLRGLKSTLKDYGKIRAGEFRTLGQNAKITKELQGQFVGQFNERASGLMKEISSLSKLRSQERLAFETMQNKAPAMAARMANNYERGARALSGARLQQKLAKQIWKINEETKLKHLADLPPEIRDVGMKFWKLLEDQKMALKEKGLIGDMAGVYTPRALTAKFADQLSKTVHADRLGFLKHREFKYAKEFFEWSDKNGMKVENDVGLLIFDHLINGDIAIARENLREGLLAAFKDERAIPKVIRENLDYLFKLGSNNLSNPSSRLTMSVYGKALNAVKFMLTAPNLAFQVRNILGFPFLAMTTAGLKKNPLGYLGDYVDVARIKAGHEFKIGNYASSIVKAAAEADGYFGASMTRGNIQRSYKMIMGQYSWYNPMRWMGEMARLSAHAEDFGRYGALVANLKTGKELSVALKAGRDAMFDYNLILSPVDKALDGMLGFYTWTRRNVPQQFKTIINDPKQYSLLSRLVERVSHRQELSDEELQAMSDYDKETLTVFGKMVDGVRKFTSYGFLPVEQAYQTITQVTNFDSRAIRNVKINPLAGSVLDWFYGEDSLTGEPMGNQLPAKYTKVIPEKVQKLFGLVKKTVPIYQAGEQVGTQEVLYGKPNAVAFFQKIPLFSRQLSEISTLVDTLGKEEKSPGLIRFVTGIREGKIDLDAFRVALERRKEKELIKAIKARGAKTIETPYVPKGEKKESAFRSLVKRYRENAVSR